MPTTTPRPVSLSMKLSIFFGSPLAWMGIAFALCGSAAAVVFGMQSDIMTPLRLSSSDPMVTGVAAGYEATGATVNDERIYDYSYRYQVGGKNYIGHGFGPDGPDEGRPLRVQYLADRPEVSRVEGLRSAPFGPWVVGLAGIFPALGFAFIYFSLRQARKYIHLVRHGILTTGRVGKKVATNTSINRQQVYEVYFSYVAHDGSRHQSSLRTHEPDKLGDEHREPMVYDPSQMSKAVLLDTMPARIRKYLIPA